MWVCLTVCVCIIMFVIACGCVWLCVQGPQPVAAADPGPAVSFMAGEGTIRPGPDAQSPDLGPADQQAGGVVEGGLFMWTRVSLLAGQLYGCLGTTKTYSAPVFSQMYKCGEGQALQDHLLLQGHKYIRNINCTYIYLFFEWLVIVIILIWWNFNSIWLLRMLKKMVHDIHLFCFVLKIGYCHYSYLMEFQQYMVVTYVKKDGAWYT